MACYGLILAIARSQAGPEIALLESWPTLREVYRLTVQLTSCVEGHSEEIVKNIFGYIVKQDEYSRTGPEIKHRN